MKKEKKKKLKKEKKRNKQDKKEIWKEANHIRYKRDYTYKQEEKEPSNTLNIETLATKTDLEIAKAALGLRAPMFVAVNLYRPHCIGFWAGFVVIIAENAHLQAPYARSQKSKTGP